jgi:two-component system, cell cycle sensor histidine kinase and response regulator CckA
LRSYIENTQSAIAVHDRDLRYIYVSKRYLDDYKVLEKDIIGKHHYEVFPDLPQKWRDVHNRALLGEICSAEDDPYYREDGTVDWTRWECRPWYEADGAIGGIIIYTEVITERKKAEDALRESEEKHRRLFETMAQGVVYHAADGTIISANPSAERILGLSCDQMYGKTSLDPRWRMIKEDGTEVPGTDHPAMIALRTGKIVGPVIRGVFHPGKNDHVWLSITAIPLFQPGETKPFQVYATFENITDRKQAEAEYKKLQSQLNQAQKMESIGRLAGGVAHDYNNMLSVIIGYTEMAMDKMQPDDPLHADLAEIFKAARRSIDITRQLLAFARKQTIAPKVVDLNTIVESMLRMLGRLIGENIDLAWLPGKQLWSVKIDPAQIDQILANLCVNARDAIEGVGKVTIETGNITFDDAYCEVHAGFFPGEFVLLAISDNGCGMDEEIVKNIFEPFFTTKGVTEGTGLGLATVYGIVRQNNGFINVYSEPGKGTTFRIYLPRHVGQQHPMRAATKIQTPMGRGETVLLVEDEPSIMRMAKMMLKRLGYQVLAAGTPSQALALAEQHAGAIDLLITDVVMPEMSGRSLANQIHVLYPDIRTLFMSGYTANVIAHNGVLDEGVNFIQKPFSHNDFGIKIRMMLDEN